MKQNLQYVAQSQANEKTQEMQDLIKEKELEQQKKKEKDEAQFNDSNFWRIQSAEQRDKDIDDLFKELEEGDDPAKEEQTQGN